MENSNLPGTITVKIGRSSIDIPFNVSQIDEEKFGYLAVFAGDMLKKEIERREKITPDGFTGAQVDALTDLAIRFNTRFVRPNFTVNGDGSAEGQIGPIYVGCSPEGVINS